jgi:uncharacterized protein YciI
MALEHRRRFIGMSLAAAAGGLVASAAAEQSSHKATGPSGAALPSAPTYLVVYRHGPRWVDGVPTSEQKSMREHFKHYLDLYRAGRLKDAGGFADESGGAAVFTAADDDAAADFVAADPAVVSGLFLYELKRWRPNPWKEISSRSPTPGNSESKAADKR